VRRFLLEVFETTQLDPTSEWHTGADSPRSRPTRWRCRCPTLSPRGLYWSATRGGLKFGGLLSEGIRLGHETGFDSGSTLDYVYRNEARGRTPLGRLIDRIYLESIGWRGIRQRKRHLEELLQEAMRRLRARGEPVRIVDIAAGRGRYVLDAVSAGAERPDSILFRDYSARNVQDGEALIEAAQLQTIARFDNADAFDRRSLAAIEPRPTIGIVSGLYELFADNDAGAGLARRPWRRDRVRRIPRVHVPALASATRVDRTRAHESPRRRGVGDAPSDAGRDGSARRDGGLPQGRAADRRMGNLYGIACPTRRRMKFPETR
jgi:hypothetical protein